MNLQGTTFLIIPESELNQIKLIQQEILSLLKNVNTGNTDIQVKHIPAKDFMAAVNIRRTKFDELVKTNKIRIIKKKRKIYVPVGEIDRYFSDASIR